jgi:hypothetical protein
MYKAIVDEDARYTLQEKSDISGLSASYVFSQDKLKLSVHLLDTAFANVWTEKGAG